MKAILTDVSKCIGCDKCVEACDSEQKQRPYKLWKWSSDDGLSGDRFTSVLRLDNNHYVRKQCRHCVSPACVSVCPVGALKKTPEGPVVYDADKCMGCRYCMMACPYGIPRYTWQDAVPLVRKCTMCYENRIKQGKQPTCTEACTEEATIFGERNHLLTVAKRRLRQQSDKYIQKVYGEKDVGGTGVLYISPVKLNFLGWKEEVGTNPLPLLTAPAMTAVLPAFFTVGAGMTALHWITKRRQMVAEMKQTETTHIKPLDRSSEDETENS
jgi:formate dehydrogenase iron-sulfur subunit